MAAARPGEIRRRPLLSVGITSANWMELGVEVGRLEEGGADFVHFDVMDGCFCPQLTFGPPLIRGVRTTLRKDVHLMIEEPLEKVAAYVEAGADAVTVHLEASRHPHRVLQALGEMKSSAGRPVTRGVALNPGTPVGDVEPLLHETELVLVLAVNPGWSGQRFIAGTGARVGAVRKLIDHSGRNVMLAVDGGITRANVEEVARMGVDLIVTGSAVFDGGDVIANLRALRASASSGVDD